MVLRICQISLLLSTTIVFIGCSGGSGLGTYNPDIGPFDENGNYVEAWADNPPKRGSKARSTQAKSKSAPKPTPKIASIPKPKPKPVVKPRPVTVAKVTPKPPPIVKATPKPVAKPTPGPVVVKPKPKPVVVKPKPTPKPKSIRHVVKKGDTLYGLSKRYGTTISAIKRANGISGTTIQTGKAYTIPR